ncbi:MAG: carbon-nitrogen family hydrolase [Deltaproteobacteria bacterium]|nr:MAG: carbon-nitrogen family hydrolase [Deltaproteobacteria bacterium]
MRIACVQMEVKGDKYANMAHAERLLLGLKGADLVILPEVWNIGYFSFDLYWKESETLDGETVRFISEMAKKLNAYILGGSMIRREGGKLYNTSLFVDNNGKLIATYDKIHLFGYGSREKELVSRGEGVRVVETDIGVFGLSTCYDLRFPELYRIMVDKGAQMFLVVAAWPYPRLEHWLMFNRVRAIENCAFLASANCVGEGDGVRFCGHSMVVDPWGVIVASGGDEEAVIWAEVELEKVRQVRAESPALRDIVFRVPDVVSLTNAPNGD